MGTWPLAMGGPAVLVAASAAARSWARRLVGGRPRGRGAGRPPEPYMACCMAGDIAVGCVTGAPRSPGLGLGSPAAGTPRPAVYGIGC